MMSKTLGTTLVVVLYLATPAVVWAQTMPTNLQLTFAGPQGGQGSTVAVSATVDQATLTAPGANRFEIVKNSLKADLGTFVARASDRRDTQAVFGLSTLPTLVSGDYYVARVSSSLDGVNFPGTAVAYSTQQIPYVGQGQHAPVAIAGEDQVVTLGSTVTLSGAQSFDPNGDGLTYLWTKTKGVTVALSNPTAVATTFVPPTTGKYTFKLRVEDDDSKEEDGPDAEYGEDTVTVTVGVWPVDAGPDQQVLGGTTVTLKAKGSTGSWSQVPVPGGATVTLATPGALETTFTAPPYNAVNVPANQLKFRWTDRGSSPVVEDDVTITVVNYSLAAFPNDLGTAVNLVSTAANDDLALAIQRSDNLGQTWFLLAGTSGQVSAFTDTTVVLGATYQYRLVYNNSVVSNVATVLVSEAPVLSGLVVTPGEIRGDGATLLVGISTPNADVEQGGKAQYRVKLVQAADFPVDWVPVSPFKDFIITSLQEGTAYDVTVRAVDAGGRAGVALQASATTLRRGEVTPAMRRKRNRDQWYEPPCFVATAVSDDAQVRILGLWRDQDLKESETGKKFIAWYYSPEGGSAWANWLDKHPWCKPVVRVGLAPLVTYAALRVGEWPPASDVLITLAMIGVVGIVIWIWRKRRRSRR